MWATLSLGKKTSFLSKNEITTAKSVTLGPVDGSNFANVKTT